MIKKYSREQPIMLGLAGRAGSGKTSVAEVLCPKGSIQTNSSGIIWEHIFYALPLYELASIKKNIMGMNEESRKLFAIHEVLFEIYGKSSLGHIPNYHIFVEKIQQIYDLPIEPEGIKPRTFLQTAGDICREGYSDCFCHWAIVKSSELYKNAIKDHSDDDTPVCIIISDVRFLNEAESILKQPNGIVINFDASDQTLKDRIFKRDGVHMTDEQLNHSSETHNFYIRENATYTINTDSLSIEQQTQATLDIMKNHIK